MLFAIKIGCIWSLIAVIVGSVAGAVIHKAERLHEEDFLRALFVTISDLQGSH
jgi:hypothetical protein